MKRASSCSNVLGFFGWSLALVVAGGVVKGCASSRDLKPASVGQILTEDERREVVAAMRAAVPEGFEPRPKRTDPRPVTWRDVPAVVAATAALHEMAVVRRDIADRWMQFELHALDDRPATITVLRNDRGELRFAARVGRFGDDHALADSLVATAEAFARGGVGRVTVAEMLDPTLSP